MYLQVFYHKDEDHDENDSDDIHISRPLRSRKIVSIIYLVKKKIKTRNPYNLWL